MQIILFPGLGADEKIFEGYNFNDLRITVIHGIIPGEKESLQHYCRRLAALINNDDDLLYIGVSFGGLLAQEIARFKPAEKVILISSIKTTDEKPRYLTWLKWIPIYKLLPVGFLKKIAIGISKYFTNKTPSEHRLFSQMLRHTDNRMIRFGIHQVVHWKGSQPLKNCIHIHGTADRIFPARLIDADYLIENGTHFMMVQQKEKINGIINEILRS